MWLYPAHGHSEHIWSPNPPLGVSYKTPFEETQFGAHLWKESLNNGDVLLSI